MLVDASGTVMAEAGPLPAPVCVTRMLEAARARGLHPNGIGLALAQGAEPQGALALPSAPLPVYRGGETEALTRGEMAFGAGRGCRDLLLLHAGDRLEAGIVLDGVLRRAPVNGVGHISVDRTAPWRCTCGMPGCLQAALCLATAGAIAAPAALASTLSPPPSVACAWLALGVVHLVNMFNPGALVLTGELLDAQPGARDWIAATVYAATLAPSRIGLRFIGAPQGGRRSALIGAAALVPSRGPMVGPGDPSDDVAKEGYPCRR